MKLRNPLSFLFLSIPWLYINVILLVGHNVSMCIAFRVIDEVSYDIMMYKNEIMRSGELCVYLRLSNCV